MANCMGGGGGANGFKHLLEHLGPASQKWLDDMRVHNFIWSPENLDALNASVVEETRGADLKALEHRRDQLTVEILKLTQQKLELSAA